MRSAGNKPKIGFFSKIVLVTLPVVLAFAGWYYVTNVLDVRYYLVSGQATVSLSALEHVRLPALICSGHGGPLESSGIYGAPLGVSLDRKPQVFCSTTKEARIFEYRESAFQAKLPREMHVYVWLEPHPELAAVCNNADSPVITIEWD